MNWVQKTRLVLWVTMLIWFAYEVLMLILNQKSALISPVILSFTTGHPQFLIFIGYLLGHLTWPQQVSKQ